MVANDDRSSGLYPLPVALSKNTYTRLKIRGFSEKLRLKY